MHATRRNQDFHLRIRSTYYSSACPCAPYDTALHYTHIIPSFLFFRHSWLLPAAGFGAEQPCFEFLFSWDAKPCQDKKKTWQTTIPPISDLIASSKSNQLRVRTIFGVPPVALPRSTLANCFFVGCLMKPALTMSLYLPYTSAASTDVEAGTMLTGVKCTGSLLTA